MKGSIRIFVLCFVFFSFALLRTGAVEWEEIVLFTFNNNILCKATSELESPEPDPLDPSRFSVVRLFDKDNMTCWAEGVSGSGIGEALFFKIPENTRTISFVNGFAGGEDLYLQNNRVKKMAVNFYAGVNPETAVSETTVQYFAVRHDKEFLIELTDTQDEQDLNFPISWTELKEFKKTVLENYESEKEAVSGNPADAVDYILKLTIHEVYKGLEYDDTCISEITVKKDFESVNSIYLSTDESAVLIDTDKKTGIEIDRDREAVFQIINFTADNQWIICIKMPKETDESRVETEYILYNTFVPKKIEKSVLGEYVLDMYGFVERGGKMYLKYLNSSNSKMEYLALVDIELK